MPRAVKKKGKEELMSADKMPSKHEEEVGGEQYNIIEGTSSAKVCGGDPAPKMARNRKICSHEGCTNLSQRRGVCDRHGAKPKCSHEGCTNITKKGGVCVSHGAKLNHRKRCSHEGCTNFEQKGGVCDKHGAKPKCSIEGCANVAKKGVMCKRHAAKDKKGISHSKNTDTIAELRNVINAQRTMLMSSRRVVLALPPPSMKLGITLGDSPAFGLPVLNVRPESPILWQIPVELRSNVLIASLKSNAIGHVQPRTADECSNLIVKAREEARSWPVMLEMVLVAQPQMAAGTSSIGTAAKRAVAADEYDGPPKKKGRRQCSVEGCTNNAVKGGICILHGERPPACSHEGCTNLAQRRGVCDKHGAKPKCSIEGCAKVAKKRGMCMKHGTEEANS